MDDATARSTELVRPGQSAIHALAEPVQAETMRAATGSRGAACTCRVGLGQPHAAGREVLVETDASWMLGICANQVVRTAISDLGNPRTRSRMSVDVGK